MKRLVTFSLGLLLCLNASLYSKTVELPGHDIEMKCQRPFQGPPGPPGQLAANYASLWSDFPQILVPDLRLLVPVEFENVQLPLVGITRPFPGDDASFQIQNSGVYLLIWSIQAVFIPLENPDALSPLTSALGFQLFNVTGGFAFDPIFNGAATLEDHDTQTITGQTTLFLEAGTILQLRALSTDPTVTLGGRTFTITQIARAPAFGPA